MHPKSDQHFWNFIFSVLFAALLALSILHVESIYGYFPYEIPLFDAVLITLATFRVIRLFSYDRITQWLRDFFLRTIDEKGPGGRVYETSVPYERGPLRTVSDLLTCPWCTGVWATLFILWTYFVFPFAWYAILLLALSGVGSFLQLVANAIGWRAEDLKHTVTSREEGDSNETGTTVTR